jgi:hypothetical protein
MLRLKTRFIYLILIGSFLMSIALAIVINENHPHFWLLTSLLISFSVQLPFLIWCYSITTTLLLFRKEQLLVNKYKLLWWLCFVSIFFQIPEGYFFGWKELSPVNHVLIFSSISQICFSIIFIFSINSSVRSLYLIDEKRLPTFMEYFEIYLSFGFFLIGIAIIHKKTRRITQHYT